MSEHTIRPTAVTGTQERPQTGSRPPQPDPHPTQHGAAQDDGPSRPSVDPGYAPGDTIAGRYELTEHIATGGMASVWRATDRVLTRPVAIKILLPHLAADPDFVARFRREAVAAARLAHPLIVAIYDTCDDPEAIIMELVEGRTLRDELDQSRFLSSAQAVAIASDVAQALDVAHKAGLVHRDVKPANVLLSGNGQVKVADFGIAKAARSAGGDEDPDLPDLTTVGYMVGTAKYLAPEQVAGGAIDARTDVYALGALLYEMLCGRPPFTGDNSLAIATARLHAMPERPRSMLRTIPVSLDRIVMKALATDPKDRYDTAAAIWADMQAAPLGDEAGRSVDQHPVDATTVSDSPSFARTERSWLVPTMLVGVVGVALVLAWLLIGGSQARENLLGLVGGEPKSEPLNAIGTSTFDPEGDGEESDDLIGRAIDGNPSTIWRTEVYTSRDLGGLKDGVGMIVDLGASRSVRDVEIISPSSGWTGEIRVADTAGPGLSDWDAPVGTVADASEGTTKIDVDDTDGRYVLFWLTDLGDDGGFRFDLGEIRISGS